VKPATAARSLPKSHGAQLGGLRIKHGLARSVGGGGVDRGAIRAVGRSLLDLRWTA
jgi:hypothetical protein